MIFERFDFRLRFADTADRWHSGLTRLAHIGVQRRTHSAVFQPSVTSHVHEFYLRPTPMRKAKINRKRSVPRKNEAVGNRDRASIDRNRDQEI